MSWSQLLAVLWLRWRLSRNQWRRRGALEAILGGVALYLFGILMLAGGVGGLAAGFWVMPRFPPVGVLLFWDVCTAVFLAFWIGGLLSELQRSEILDLSRLLHLPVSTRSLFIINYAASHATFSVLVTLPVFVGLTLGWSLQKGVAILLLLPLGFSLLFAITAWTYFLRGFLAAVMINPRRRRSVLVGATLAFVLFFQLPNILALVARNSGRENAPDRARAVRRAPIPPAFMVAHDAFPPLWVARGAMALKEGQLLPVLLFTLGAGALGGLGLWRAYYSTFRFYRGYSHSPARVQRTPSPRTQRSWIDRRWPGVSPPVHAVAAAMSRHFLRAPEIRMTLISTIGVPIMLCFVFLLARRQSIPPQAEPLIATSAVMIALLPLVQIFFNQFGLDRDGFRSLVLAPLLRRDVLLGKNLATGLVAALGSGASLLLVHLFVLFPINTLMATVCQALAGVVMLSLAGNLASILVPYRMATGSLKKAKTPLTTTLRVAAIQLLAPLLFLPMSFGPMAEFLIRRSGENLSGLLNLSVSLGVFVLLAAIYLASLAPIGRLLEGREQAILTAVAVENE